MDTTPPLLSDVRANLRLARDFSADAMAQINQIAEALNGSRDDGMPKSFNAEGAAMYRAGVAKQIAKNAAAWTQRSEGFILLALEGLNDHINSLAGLGDDEPPRAA